MKKKLTKQEKINKMIWNLLDSNDKHPRASNAILFTEQVNGFTPLFLKQTSSASYEYSPMKWVKCYFGGIFEPDLFEIKEPFEINVEISPYIKGVASYTISIKFGDVIEITKSVYGSMVKLQSLKQTGEIYTLKAVNYKESRHIKSVTSFVVSKYLTRIYESPCFYDFIYNHLKIYR